MSDFSIFLAEKRIRVKYFLVIVFQTKSILRAILGTFQKQKCSDYHHDSGAFLRLIHITFKEGSF